MRATSHGKPAHTVGEKPPEDKVYSDPILHPDAPEPASPPAGAAEPARAHVIDVLEGRCQSRLSPSWAE